MGRGSASIFPKSPGSRKTSSVCRIFSTSCAGVSDRTDGWWARFIRAASGRDFWTGCAWPASSCRRSCSSDRWRSNERFWGGGGTVIPIMMVVCLAIFALAAGVIVAMGAGPSKLVRKRLDALQWESAPTEFEETADIRREEQAGRIVWLNRWMVKINIAPRTRLLLYQAEVKTPPERLVLTSVAGWLIAGCAIYWRTGAIGPAVFLSALFIPVPWILVFRKRAKRFAKIEQQLPEGLDMLVGALKVGHSLITAIGALGQDASEPLAGEFRKLFDEQNFGLDPHTALTNLALRVPLPDVRIFV